MRILDVIQGSQNWLDVRAKHNTASEAPAVMGASKYCSRSDLLRQKSTGITPEVDAYKQSLFDRGHATEETARCIVEEMLGDTLYPITAVCEETGLLASLDGLTMDETIVFEHKLWSEGLAAQVRAGELEPHYYWQLEQELLVTKAEKVVFVTSDGTREKFAHMEYRSVSGRREQLIAAWKQFDIDLEAYVPVEVLDKPIIITRRPDQLPALKSSVTGELVLESNIKEWEEAALAYIKGVSEHELKTDEDFENADAAAKWCVTSKTTLQGVQASLMSATGDVNVAVSTLDRIMEELDKTRLAFTKKIDARKAARKGELLLEHQTLLGDFLRTLNKRLGRDFMPQIPVDFAGAIHGKRNFDSMGAALNAALANAKITANAIADKIQINLNVLADKGNDYDFLFNDLSTIVLKANDDFATLVDKRVTDHKVAKLQQEEQTRERIRAEEQAKAEKAAREKLQAEQQAAEKLAAQQREEVELTMQAAMRDQVVTGTGVVKMTAVLDGADDAPVMLVERIAPANVMPMRAATPPAAAPAPASAPAPAVSADGWQPAETMPKMPDQWIQVQEVNLYRFLPYKTNSTEYKRGKKGRWQRHNGYGFENSEPPVGQWRIGEETETADAA